MCAERKCFVGSEVDYNRYNMSLYELIAVLVMSAIADGIVSFLFYRSIFVFVAIIVPMSVLFVKGYKRNRIEKRKWALECGFEEMLESVSNALITGYSLENSFYEAKKELSVLYDDKRDILCELGNICRKIKFNCKIESILMDFAKRSGIDDIHTFSEIIIVARKSGGNIISIVKQTAENIHDRREIEGEIRTLISGKKLEYRIMCIMPVGMLIYLGICSPGYMDVMYGNIAGQAVMTICLVIYAVSYYIAKKIMSFESSKEIKASGKKHFSGDFCRLYRILKKGRFGGTIDKISKKAAKVYIDIPQNEACRRFWNEWFAYAKTGLAAAGVIVMADVLSGGKNIVYVLLFAAAVAVSIPYMKLKEVDRKLKYRDEQLILDYPDVINRICLLIGAGSSMKRAWEKIVNDYTENNSSNKAGLHYVYEEMKKSLLELKSGTPESVVYERFGQRIRLIPYMKLSAILVHNLKKGNRYILEQLNMSSLDAYGQRKESIKRMGEEASSKLLFPIILQFILVLIIIMYPAIISL